MRTSLAGRPGPARLGSRLLLALALCACGEAGEEGEGEALQAEEAVQTAPEGVSTASTASCTNPPPGYALSVLTGEWQTLLDSLAADSVTFPEVAGNDTTALVALCRNCPPVRVELRSSNFTPCLGPADLGSEQRRIVGMFILHDTFPAQPGWQTIPAGDTIFAFANTIGGPATMVYRDSSRSVTAPSKAWRFWYCQDGHSATAPQAQWRPRTAANTGTRATTEDDGGTYGWMACISGCCQFYTPPPEEIELPEKANPKAGEAVQNKPSWCTAPD